MNFVRVMFAALLALFLQSNIALSAPITSDQVNLLNKAGGIPAKVGLGTIINNITPAYVVRYGGTHTSTADASSPHQNTITVSGVLSTDLVLATVKTPGGTPVSVIGATPTANTITLRYSGDPSTDHVISYVVLRAP